MYVSSAAATKKTRCRYGDLPELKECFGPAAVYMSHCWGAKFGDLVGAACYGASKDRIVWIDIFAVRQWPGNVADIADLNFLSSCITSLQFLCTILCFFDGICIVFERF